MKNPIYLRYRASQKRAKTVGTYGLVYALTLLLMGIWAAPDRLNSLYPWQLEFSTTFYACLWLLEVLLLIWAAVQTGRVLPKEVEQKSIDFFRLLPLSPKEKFFGLALGVNAPLVFLLLTNLGLETLVVVGSRHSLGTHVQLQLMTLLAGLFLQVVAFLLSTTNRRQAALQNGKLLRLLVGVPLALSALPFLIGGTATLASMKEGVDFAVRIPCFSANLPIFLLVSLVLLSFTAWGYAGCLRSLHAEEEPLFPRPWARIFFAQSTLLVFGFFMSGAEDSRASRYGAFASLLVLFAVFAFLGAKTSVKEYLESRQKLKKPLRQLWIEISNLRLGSELVALAAIALSAGAHVLGYSWSELGLLLGTLILTFSILCLLSEVLTLSGDRKAHAGLIIGFTLVVYVIFPLLLSFSGLDAALTLSGVDFLFFLLGKPERARELFPGMVVSHALYFVALFAIVRSNYRRLNVLSEHLDGKSEIRIHEKT